MMKFKKGSIVLLLLMLIVLAVGCQDDIKPVPTPEREYGPPLGEISFIDGSGGLGTIYKDATAHFISEVGVGATFTDPGVIALWRVNSTDSNAELMFRDGLNEEVIVIDQDASYTSYGENVPPFGFAYSQFGSKIAVVETENDTSRLYYKSLSGSYVVTKIAELYSPWEFDSKPSINTAVGESGIIIREINTSTTESRLVIYGISEMMPPDETIDYVNAYAPVVSRDGSDFACLTGGSSTYDATNVYIADWSNPTTTRVINFGSIAAGATDISWSPDGQYLTLISGISTDTPHLILIDKAMQTAEHIDIADVPVFGEGDDRYFNAPCWNDSSNAITMLAEDQGATNQYKVVRVNILEDNPTVIDIKTGLEGISFPQWRESDPAED